MTDIERDDVHEMRQQGDLGRFLRDQIRAGRSRRELPPKPVALKPPGHRPGAWPSGTSPPGPPPERQIPKHLWDAAVRHYSNEEHRPDQPCDCGNCPEETR